MMGKQNKQSKNTSYTKREERADYHKDNKYKSKGRNSKSRKDDVKTNGSYGNTVSHNDISWYVPTGANLADVASLNFNNPNNGSISIEVNGAAGRLVDSAPVPGICSIDLVPSIGVNSGMQDAATSAINLASKSMEAFIRASISGSRTWEANDLALAILAFDGVTSLWSYLVRLYGCVNLYSFENKYLPKGLLVAMGVPQSIAAAAPAYQNRLRSIINMMSLRLSTFPIVKLPYLSRHIYLSGNVFTDNSSTLKGQFYLYNLKRVFVLNEEGTGCSAEEIIPTTNTWTSYSHFLDHIEQLTTSIIDRIHYSTDLSIIAGDILKAYGNESLINLGMISDDLTITPTYDETILTQIHNSSITPLAEGNEPSLAVSQVITTRSQYLTQDTGYFNAGSLRRRIIDLPYASVSPENVMYATRLMTLVSPMPDDPSKAYLTSGSEIVTGMSIWRLEGENFISHSFNNDMMVYYANSLSNSNIIKLLLSTQFNSFPLLYTSHANSSSAANATLNVCGSLQNYTSISNVELKRIHDVAFAGMFGLPYTLTKRV